MGMKKVAKKVGKIVSTPIRVPVKKVKEHNARKKEYPKDDVSEESITNEVVEDKSEEVNDMEKIVTPGFAFSGSYSFDENGNPIENNSTMTVEPQNNISNDAIIEIILNNQTIKELVPNIQPNDISLYNGMLLMKVMRSETTNETFRIDLVGEKVMIQAPLSHPYIRLDNKVEYKFASVDVSSEIGRNILTNENYIIRLKDVDPRISIMRTEQDAA